MTLDLARIARQITAMIAELQPDDQRSRFAALERTWETLDGADIKARLDGARHSFLLPAPQDNYKERHPLPDPRES